MVETEGRLIGPHEGRELVLMLTKAKPLSIFTFENIDGWCEFPEREFDEQVTFGKFIKHEQVDTINLISGTPVDVRTVIYSLLEEEWRIPAYLFINQLYKSLAPGYRPDFERIIGGLLGYKEHEVEAFLDHLRNKNARFA